MQVLDNHQATVVRSLCERLLPGSARVWPEVYVDALLARMSEDDRAAILAAIAVLEPDAGGDSDALGQRAFTPEFMLLRALACEAFYSDFVAPGAPGPGAWSEIGFAPPLAVRLDKDWSYLGVGG
jgi:hypothetical protein